MVYTITWRNYTNSMSSQKVWKKCRWNQPVSNLACSQKKQLPPRTPFQWLLRWTKSGSVCWQTWFIINLSSWVSGHRFCGESHVLGNYLVSYADSYSACDPKTNCPFFQKGNCPEIDCPFISSTLQTAVCQLKIPEHDFSWNCPLS